ncbi:hypothetical protein V490_00049 [Pseudogymnoascus sp. VKM F-3557]|nr:hypothetical protein V490_00049 [Pseudogymnoascus sp. VKM F-3557]
MPPSSLSNQRRSGLGHSSTVGPGALMGSANYHGRIRFHDGSPSWLFRVPGIASFAYEQLEYSVTVLASASSSWKNYRGTHGQAKELALCAAAQLVQVWPKPITNNRHITIQASIFNPS